MCPHMLLIFYSWVCFFSLMHHCGQLIAIISILSFVPNASVSECEIAFLSTTCKTVYLPLPSTMPTFPLKLPDFVLSNIISALRATVTTNGEWFFNSSRITHSIKLSIIPISSAIIVDHPMWIKKIKRYAKHVAFFCQINAHFLFFYLSTLFVEILGSD